MTTFQKGLLLSLIIALINAAVLVVFYVPRFIHTDTAEYVSTIEYIAGEPGSAFVVYRMLKPLPILIGALLNPVLDAGSAMVFQSLIFYFLSVWLIFLLIHRLYGNVKQACYGTVLYIGAYPMLAFGLAPLTDISGWFFYLLSVFIVLDFIKKPRMKTALLSGFVAGFGMLFKENSAAAPLFFASLVFVAAQIPIKEKLKYIFAFGSVFLIFPIINTIIIYSLYSYSYYDWFRMGGIHPEGGSGLYMVSPFRILIEIGRVLLIGWFFVFFGIIKEFAVKNIERVKILLAFILPSLSVFVWSYPHNRMLFIAAPLLALLGSFGLLMNFKNPKINSAVEISLLSLYIFLNYAALEFFLRYGPIIQPPGTLFG